MSGNLDWDKLRVFYQVAEASSFTRAGEQLGLSQSAVSRQISALEQSINQNLFYRHARGLTLTQAGEMLYETVREVFAKLSAAENMLTDNRDQAEGDLKITTTPSFGSVWLVPRLKHFMQMHPGIKVTLDLSERMLDLSRGEADLAIRFKRPTNQDLIQRHIATIHAHLYAAPEYLSQYGMPHSIEELKQHRLITYVSTNEIPSDGLRELNNSIEAVIGRIEPVLAVSNMYGIFRAVRSGMGIGMLPEYYNFESRNLVQVLPQLATRDIDAYFVFPEEIKGSKRIQAFRDFILAEINRARTTASAA